MTVPCEICADDAVAAQLGDLLRRRGFAVAGVRAALGGADVLSPGHAQLAGYLARLPGDSALSTLIKLLLLTVEVDERDARSALSPLGLIPLERAGVLNVEAGKVSANLRILPHEGLLLACDRDHSWGTRSRDDHVGGVHGSTAMLAQLSPRPLAASTLDIGTGCGVHALLAACHSRRVIATDTNPRALAFTDFNARLNGITNVECRQGSLFDPVIGERFDLILSNPPFVISPDAAPAYSASGMPGDLLCERLVRGLTDHLTSRGIGCVLASWRGRAGEHWSERPREWLEEGPASRLLFHLETIDAETNARRWARPSEPGADAHEREVLRWVEHYRRIGIDCVAYGAVVAQQSTRAAPWTFAVDLVAPPGPGAGIHVMRLLDTQHWLRESSERELLDSVVALVPDHSLEEPATGVDATRQVNHVLRLTGGLPLGLTVDRQELRLATHLDGQRTLREALASAGFGGGFRSERASEDWCGAVRRLAVAGLLEVRRHGCDAVVVPDKGEVRNYGTL